MGSRWMLGNNSMGGPTPGEGAELKGNRQTIAVRRTGWEGGGRRV